MDLYEKAKGFSDKGFSEEKPKISRPKTKEPTKKIQSPQLEEKLKLATRICGLTEGLLRQLIAWKKFEPQGQYGKQGDVMRIILEEIGKFNQ